MKNIERTLEHIIFASRWLLAPFYFGLVAAIALLLVKFAKEFVHIAPLVFGAEGEAAIIGILSLVDIALVANLLLIIIFAGYENFVSKIDTGDHEDRPEWMGHVDFSDLKIKLIGSIVAISGIELLKAFVRVGEMSNVVLGWKVGIHMTLVVSAVLFSVMDRLGAYKHQK
ncbi:MAG: TIGR00645 family protein [Nitrospirae bacterium]|nr:TIGR00645 family protein [Nitrospirota bacterium]